MKKWIFLLLVLPIGYYVSAQNKEVKKEAEKQGPIIKFESESFNFGQIDDGAQAKHDFTYTNIGDEDLILQDVHPGCGCTTPYWSKEPLKPGQSAKITSVFNSNGYKGQQFHKSITVTTNMKKDNVKVIYFTGTVVSKASDIQNPPQPNSPVRVNP